jgi:uncharacterized membrane protein YfcA
MQIDFYVVLAGAVVGFVVGLTGMGGGALMTPLLVLVFGVQPLAAVSSDLVASMIMKPAGSAVHLHRGTVHRTLVKWLVAGSVPSAFAGVFILRSFGEGEVVQQRIRYCLAATLLLAVGAMVVKAFTGVLANSRERRGARRPLASLRDTASSQALSQIEVHPVRTVMIGVVGGLVVGMTSVGSGSLIIVLLLFAYPSLRAGELVGTDLVQAVPLVTSAAVGHLLFGDFRLDLTTSLLLGSLPAVYVGAQVSAQAPGRLVRRALMIVLFASGLKLAEVGMTTISLLLVFCLVVVPFVWIGVRRAYGLPARAPSVRSDGGRAIPRNEVAAADSGRATST